MQGGSCVETIVELCKRRLPENMKIPSNQIQVLSPSRKGETGTANLNKCLQAALNPPDESKKEKLFGETVFRTGDRVIQIKNNYDIVWKDKLGKSGMGVYNGDIGTIVEIDTASEYLKVDYEDKIALYGFEMLNELEHAWALTVHKSQGSEYRRRDTFAQPRCPDAAYARCALHGGHARKGAAHHGRRRRRCPQNDRQSQAVAQIQCAEDQTCR